MSFANRFVSEKEIEEQKELYGGPKKEVEYDGRTLYEKLQEQKQKKEDELALKHKDKASEGLNDEDILYYKEKERAENEKKKQEADEIQKELLSFKKEQANLLVTQTNSNNKNSKVIDEVIQDPVLSTTKKNKLVNVKLVSNNSVNSSKSGNIEVKESPNKKQRVTETTTTSKSSLFASYDSDSDNDSEDDKSDDNNDKEKQSRDNEDDKSDDKVEDSKDNDNKKDAKQ